jgi:hypothetical protein
MDGWMDGWPDSWVDERCGWVQVAPSGSKFLPRGSKWLNWLPGGFKWLEWLPCGSIRLLAEKSFDFVSQTASVE